MARCLPRPLTLLPCFIHATLRALTRPCSVAMHGRRVLTCAVVCGIGVVPRGEQGVQKRKLHGATGEVAIKMGLVSSEADAWDA